MKIVRRMLPLFLAALTLGLLIGLYNPSIASEDKAGWSYGGAENPTQWGRLEQDFEVCEIGRDQSPIDLEEAVEGAPANIIFNYEPAPLEVVNNGHTIQVNYAEGSSVSINGENYDLLQFHFHTPSEHTLDGEATAMELHFVHRNEAMELAVVGVMLKAGTANPVIETIWEQIPAEAETKQAETKQAETKQVGDMMINAADLLPSSATYYSYAGSLTTPPCSEAVKWNVLAEPIEVSKAQIDAFSSLYQVNARPVQPTNGRIIERHAE